MFKKSQPPLDARHTAALIEQAKQANDGELLAIAKFLHHEATNASKANRSSQRPSWWRLLLGLVTG